MGPLRSKFCCPICRADDLTPKGERMSTRKLIIKGGLSVKRQLITFAIGAALLNAAPNPITPTARAQFISADTYTRYELLAPESHQFKIYYEVTETQAGARFHFNQIREGSEASDESVVDLATGKPLKFEVVDGTQARKDSPSENFPATAHYIKV